MGRDLKRVPIDFDWPLNMPWKGYVSPYHPQKCLACGQSGYNPATRKFRENFCARSDKLTQEDVEALQDEGYLTRWNEKLKKNTRWEGLTAEMVNDAQRRGPFAEPYVNKEAVIKVRAKRLGIYGLCKYCNGHGSVWPSPEIEKLEEDWESIPPPSGDGWQLWETVSEGSPISPVFETAEGLIDWIVKNENASREAVESFVKGSGHAPSMVITNGVVFSGIEGVHQLNNAKNE